MSENLYWRSTDEYQGANTLTGPTTAGFQDMAKLKAAKPRVKVVEADPVDGRRTWNVTLSNKSGRIAFFCQLLLCDADKEPIHRTLYSDNFISLLPGQSQTITVSAPAGYEGTCQFKFNEALNPEYYIALK